MDGRIAHSEETQIKAANLFALGHSYHAVATYLGIPYGTVRIWQDSHRQGRLLNSDLVKENKRYSQQLKVAAVEKFLSGTHEPKSRKPAVIGSESREQKVSSLEMENALLKKIPGSSDRSSSSATLLITI